MDVEPSKRFQTAEEMRHALEQVNIRMNWNEQTLSNGAKWTSGWDHKCYEVVRTHTSNGKWFIETRKGSSKHTLKRITALCYKGLSKAKAVQITKRILQDHVLGKLH